jgi:hypothetical protein
VHLQRIIPLHPHRTHLLLLLLPSLIMLLPHHSIRITQHTQLLHLVSQPIIIPLQRSDHPLKIKTRNWL